jgi:glycosyltransferase involved in cell wall biosynthesis
MAQNAPCIRNYKETVALRKRGHIVFLACFANRLDGFYGIEDGASAYDGEIPLHSPEDLLDVAEWFDVVHVHNEPDTFAATMTVSDVPSIHDCHDAMSIRGLGYNRIEEALANKFSNGCVFVSDYSRARMHEKYGDAVPSVVFNSFVLEDYVPAPDEHLPKLGRASGEIHFVYEGGFNENPQTHRYLVDIFRPILKAGAWIHVYGLCTADARAHYVRELDSPRLVFHNRLHPKELIREMTQYDVGICTFNLTNANKHHLHSTLPNKLFEYLVAGLPVMISPLTELDAFINKHKCGYTFTGDGEEAIELARVAAEVFRIDPRAFTVEGNIGKIEALYTEIGCTPRHGCTLDFPPIEFEVDEPRKSLLFRPAKGSKMVKRSLVGQGPSADTVRLESIIANGAGEDL